jgi:hypothetical protein
MTHTFVLDKRTVVVTLLFAASLSSLFSFPIPFFKQLQQADRSISPLSTIDLALDTCLALIPASQLLSLPRICSIATSTKNYPASWQNNNTQQQTLSCLAA